MNKNDAPPVSRESDKFMLRLPDGMREYIAMLAKSNNRSMNAEIVARLEESFKPRSMVALEEIVHNEAFAQALADVMEKTITKRGLTLAPISAENPPIGHEKVDHKRIVRPASHKKEIKNG